MMKQVSNKPRLFWCRAILFAGTLLCLCVSDSAGLRLLPLPASNGSHDVKLSLRASGVSTSRTPSPNKESNNTYLQMVSGSQYRARDRHYHAQAATHAPAASCLLQPNYRETTPETYAPLNFKTALLSTPKGRAPPRFVS
jgi:hypothetical protein